MRAASEDPGPERRDRRSSLGGSTPPTSKENLPKGRFSHTWRWGDSNGCVLRSPADHLRPEIDRAPRDAREGTHPGPEAEGRMPEAGGATPLAIKYQATPFGWLGIYRDARGGWLYFEQQPPAPPLVAEARYALISAFTFLMSTFERSSTVFT
jgi:hypothetical protein